MKRILFFATPADIVPVLQQFESNAPLKFVVMGNLTTPNRAIYLSSSEIPDKGISTRETGNASTAYMVSHRDTKNHMTKFLGRAGEYRWTLENGSNEETVVLTMGGLWKDDILLEGLMVTLHGNPVAQQIMKWFLGALKQEGFTKVETWWLGRGALDMLRAGKRLTQAAQSPPEYDLALPDKAKAR